MADEPTVPMPTIWPPGEGWTFYPHFDPDKAGYDNYNMDLAIHDGTKLTVLEGCSLHVRKGRWYGPAKPDGQVGDPMPTPFVITHVRLHPYPEAPNDAD